MTVAWLWTQSGARGVLHENRDRMSEDHRLRGRRWQRSGRSTLIGAVAAAPSGVSYSPGKLKFMDGAGRPLPRLCGKGTPAAVHTTDGRSVCCDLGYLGLMGPSGPDDSPPTAAFPDPGWTEHFDEGDTDHETKRQQYT